MVDGHHKLNKNSYQELLEMTKFRISSDWHTEFYQYKSHIGGPRDCSSGTFLKPMENEKEQVLILAGDIINTKSIDMINNTHPMDNLFLNLSLRFKKIFIIAGNHEHYSDNYRYAKDKLDSYFTSKFDNIHYLEKESFLYDGVLIFGATLWTNFSNDYTKMDYARRGMNDFRVIYNGPADMPTSVLLSPEATVYDHNETISVIEEYIKTPYKKLIITHHSPSFIS